MKPYIASCLYDHLLHFDCLKCLGPLVRIVAEGVRNRCGATVRKKHLMSGEVLELRGVEKCTVLVVVEEGLHRLMPMLATPQPLNPPTDPLGRKPCSRPNLAACLGAVENRNGLWERQQGFSYLEFGFLERGGGGWA